LGENLLAPSDGAVGARRTAQAVADVLAQDAQVFVRLPVCQDFVKQGADKGTVAAGLLGLTREGSGKERKGSQEQGRADSNEGIHGSKGSRMFPNFGA
jgi:hypothetical protein